ncbi:hypothetical protein C8R44DRAFT_746329 [Mycena epipterygia]|nr:hypothetical protein C8R44DRAFT_746329 [Mycena epipterygia]
MNTGKLHNVIGNTVKFPLRHPSLSLSAISFTAYTTPHPSSQFSPQYFAELTIADANTLVQTDRLPRILPKRSIQKWVFDLTKPTAASEIHLAPGEDIPCLVYLKHPIDRARRTAPDLSFSANTYSGDGKFCTQSFECISGSNHFT